MNSLEKSLWDLICIFKHVLYIWPAVPEQWGDPSGIFRIDSNESNDHGIPSPVALSTQMLPFHRLVPISDLLFVYIVVKNPVTSSYYFMGCLDCPAGKHWVLQNGSE